MIADPVHPVIIVDREWNEECYGGDVIRAIADHLRQMGHTIYPALTAEDGICLVAANPDLGCLLVSWDTDPKYTVIDTIRARYEERIPLFLMAERKTVRDIPVNVIDTINGYIWKVEDTPDFIAGRVSCAIQNYLRQLLPPFFGEMVQFARHYEYSWHTPGHTGGTAFLKSPVGREYFRFFGEQLFRSDLSVSVEELGSLLKHSGPVGEAERNAARIFGSDMTYFVTNGTSTSNRIVFQACVIDGDSVIVDRNCHKSIEQALTLTGCVPTYLMPDRNGYGIIGPIPPDRLVDTSILTRINEHPLAPGTVERAGIAVITNSTYDGLCYHVPTIIDKVGGSVNRLHFDEAWYGYARFNPMYRDRFAMDVQVNSDDVRTPTLFATQSTHKLLAALSQASMIHVKNSGRAPVDHGRFNEAFMMHSSTSPQYAIIASNDVAAAMMEGKSGHALTHESIAEAVDFRQMMARLHKEMKAKNDWWFTAWQPKKVQVGPNYVKNFEDADPQVLCTTPECWVLKPRAKWHGFEKMTKDYCLLDPIKVNLITPGIAVDGTMHDIGIPASIVTSFLDSWSIVVEKTGDYTMLFLFSMGITKGKWGTLIDSLFEFKRLYDSNAPLDEALPSLVQRYPTMYGSKRLDTLCSEMHQANRDLNIPEKLRKAFEVFPTQAMRPSEAYHKLVRNRVKRIPVKDMVGKIAAVGLVPYPPGIPVLMPGEVANENAIQYLKALQDFDLKFPGFEHEVHGVEFTCRDHNDEDQEKQYWVYCIEEN